MSDRCAYIRVDASTEIGAGHAVRCMTLASELQARDWQVTFFINGEATIAVPGLKDFPNVPIRGSVDDEITTMAAHGDGHVDLLVIDHYGKDATYHQRVRTFADTIAVIDDLPDRSFAADVLLDQNLGRQRAEYAGDL
jgi:UDP-2,4-diacetamido-2,4,6-trideoxy-beta-L-altropyranose hydrolase